MVQNDNRHLQSVSASTVGNLQRIRREVPSHSEADEHMGDRLEASAAPVSSEDVCLNGHHGAPSSQSSFPSAGMLALYAISCTLLFSTCSVHAAAQATSGFHELPVCDESSAIYTAEIEQVVTTAKYLLGCYCLQ